MNRRLLSFPVIAFFSDCVCVFRDIESLTLGSKWGIKTQYYNDSLIVDGKGTAYRVSHARKSRGLHWGSVLSMFGFVIVDLVISEVSVNCDYTLIKQLIVDDIARDPELAYERDPESIANVARCNSFNEVYHYIVYGPHDAEGG